MITLQIDTARLNRAIAAMMRELPSEVTEPLVRRVAFGVVHDVQVGIFTGGFGNPRRVDTGRYVGAWRMAGNKLGVGNLGGTGPARAGDGQMQIKVGADKVAIVLTNAVEYAADVEYGTPRMRPGNHVATAMARGADDVEDMLAQLTDRWWRLE